MNTEFHPKRLLTTLGFLTLFLITGLIAMVPAESTVHEEDNIPIATLIELSFDDTGIADSVFADSSTLESTVDALELIQILELKYTDSIRRMHDKLTDQILSLQDSGGGFKASNDSARPDIKTTALSLKALNLMGRLDTETRSKAHFYLGNFFSSGLNFDEWLTNGVFEPKYWGLVASKELGGVGAIGMDKLSLANVHLSQPDDASGVVLLWDDAYFKSNSSDPFNDMSIDKQIQVIDSFRFMISDEKHRPTVLSLLIDPISMLNTLMDGYNETTGLFGPSVTETSLDYSESVYRVLSELGDLGRVFDNDNGTRRLQALYSTIENHLNIAEKSVESLDASISEILAALRISRYVPYEFSSYHTEYIPANDGSAFLKQNVSDYSLQEPKREPVHNQIPTSDLVVNLVLISSLIGIGIISSFLKGKWFFLLVTLLMVFMFLVQVFMSVAQITNAGPEFLSHPSSQGERETVPDMGWANMMWTSRVEIESGGFSGEHDQDTEGSISPDSEASTASGQIPITGTQVSQGVVDIATPEFSSLTSISIAGFSPIIGTDLSIYLDSVLAEIEHIQYESQLEVMEAYPEIEPGETLEPDRIAEILKTSSDTILDRIIEYHDILKYVRKYGIEEAMARFGILISTAFHWLEQYREYVIRAGKDDTYQREGRLEQAKDVYQKAAEHDPQYIEAWGNLGTVCSMLGLFDEADGYFDTAFEIDEHYAWTWLAWGNHLLAQGHMEDAEAAFLEAKELDPTDPRMWFALGMINSQDNPAYAEQAYRKALEIVPGDSVFRYSLAEVLEKQGKYDEAEKHLRKVLEKEPDASRVLTLLGVVLFEQSRGREAADTSLKAVQAAPKDFHTLVTHASICFECGFLRQACTVIEQAISLRPGYVEGCRMLIKILGEMGLMQEQENMEHHLQSLLDANPHCVVDDNGFLVPEES